MCYHVSTKEKGKLIEALPTYEVKGDPIQYFHVSGFARPYLPVTLNSEPKVIQEARWKLIPHWVKTEEEAKKYANTLNAESSEIFDKASYKPYIKKYRGLLWIDGFYEPHNVEGKKDTENFYIYRPNKELFSLGIVYAPWVDTDTGEVTNTFSVITVKANELLAEIHNEKKRMPLIIAPGDREAWLNASTKEDIEALFKPYPDGELSAHKIATRVTAPKKGQETNTPDVQNPEQPGAAPEQGSLFG